MKITRFVATPDGGSQFEEIDIPITNERQDAEGNTLLLSNTYTSPGVCFVDLPEGLEHVPRSTADAARSSSTGGTIKLSNSVLARFLDVSQDI